MNNQFYQGRCQLETINKLFWCGRSDIDSTVNFSSGHLLRSNNILIATKGSGVMFSSGLPDRPKISSLRNLGAQRLMSVLDMWNVVWRCWSPSRQSTSSWGSVMGRFNFSKAGIKAVWDNGNLRYSFEDGRVNWCQGIEGNRRPPEKKVNVKFLKFVALSAKIKLSGHLSTTSIPNGVRLSINMCHLPQSEPTLPVNWHIAWFHPLNH